MSDLPGGVLLDTCAVIWLATAAPMADDALAAITGAGATDALYVSPVSAWEIGMLSRPRQGRPDPVQFLPDPKSWFRRFTSAPGIREAAFTPEIAIDASWLPGELHGDPADRLLIATARTLGCPIVTRDRKIINYGAAGFVRVVPC
jgi:PIN domain nuclease of toxin-antitoxin system